jgi:integrase
MPIINLNQQTIKSLACPIGSKKIVYFDSTCKGLFLEVRESGGRTYYLRFTDERGKSRQLKLGDARDITLGQAKQQADKKRNEIAMGHDPREAKANLKKIPTVSEFIHKVYLPFVEGYKKSWKCDRGLLKNHVLPVWGNRYLDQITKSDLITLLSNYRKTHAPGSCNRLTILLRYLFNTAIKNGDVGITKNPMGGHPLMKEVNKQERFLTSEEAEVLYEKLKLSDNTMLQYIVPMLILTGARKREVLDARWEDFDIERRSWRIHTTKLGRPRHVPLSDGAVALLHSMKRFDDCPWAFPNPQTLKPYVSIFYSWNSARKAAGLKDVRIHDLRHSFASFLVNAGRSLYEVQHLLGHTQVKTTQRYSHLTKDTLLDASNAVTRAVGHLFMPTLCSPPSAGLLPMAQ